MGALISSIEVFGIQMPLNGTFTSGGQSKSAIKCVVLRIHDTDGTVGISSIDPSTRAKPPHTGADIANTLRASVAPALIGQDPANIHHVIEYVTSLTGSAGCCRSSGGRLHRAYLSTPRYRAL